MKITLKVNRNKLMIMLGSLIVSIMLCEVAYLSWRFVAVARIQLLGRCVMVVVSFCFLIRQRLNGSVLRFKKMYLQTLVYIGWISICTLLGKGNIIVFVNTFSSILLVITFLELFDRNEEYLNTVLSTWKYYILLLILVDILTEFFFPEGLYMTELYTENWFLGYKTARVAYSFPMYMIFAYQAMRQKKALDWKFYLISFVAIVNTAMSKATAALLMYVIITCIIATIDVACRGQRLGLKRFVKWVLNYRFVIAIYVLVVLTMVVFERSEYFSIFLKMLGKRTDFSGRVRIWLKCIDVLCESPLVGVGHQGSMYYVDLVSLRAATSAHNLILTLLMSGGIVGALIYLWLCRNACYRQRKIYTQVDMMLYVCLYGVLLLGVTSSSFVFSPFSFLFFWFLDRERYCGKGRKYLVL